MDETSTLKTIHDLESTNELKEIPIDPIQTYCHQCGKTVTTYIKKDLNFYIILLIIIILYFYGFLYGSFILLITLPLFKNVTHTCPNCMCLLYERQFYPIQKKERYLTLQYGKCLIVINVFYVLTLISIIIIFGFYLNISHNNLATSNPSLKDEQRKEHLNEFFDKILNKGNATTNLTWEEFITDCGSNVMVENSARAIEIFNRKYYKHIVTWRGYFLNAFVQNVRPFEVHSDHVVNLNIRMIPSESLKSQDVVLSLDDERYKEYLFELRRLNTGSPLLFTGTIESLGDEWKAHHIHLKTIEMTEDFISPEKKMVLFKGINFDISGHLKVERDVIQAKEIEASNQQLLKENVTQEVIDENLKDIDLSLDDDDDEEEKKKKNVGKGKRNESEIIKEEKMNKTKEMNTPTTPSTETNNNNNLSSNKTNDTNETRSNETSTNTNTRETRIITNETNHNETLDKSPSISNETQYKSTTKDINDTVKLIEESNKTNN